MRLSKKFRRGVLVPLNDKAARACAAQDVDDTTEVWLRKIDDEVEFNAIWRSGFFAAVNRDIGSGLDDDEEDEIAAELVPRVRDWATQYAKVRAGGDLGPAFFAALVEGCDIAMQAHMPMYFVL